MSSIVVIRGAASGNYLFMYSTKSSSLLRDSNESAPFNGKNKLQVNVPFVFGIARSTDLNLGHKWNELVWK